MKSLSLSEPREVIRVIRKRKRPDISRWVSSFLYAAMYDDDRVSPVLTAHYVYNIVGTSDVRWA
jgi:hypothetical protein